MRDPRRQVQRGLLVLQGWRGRQHAAVPARGRRWRIALACDGTSRFCTAIAIGFAGCACATTMGTRLCAGLSEPPKVNLAQARTGIHPEIDTAADRVPLGGNRDRLADGVQVAPALGEAAVAHERRAAAMPVHEIHRLTRAVAGVERSQSAARPLLERRLLAGSDGVPQLGDHRIAIEAPGVEDRIGTADGVLDLRVLAEQAGRAAARRLAAGKLDQRVDAGACDTGNHRAVVWPDPALDRQGICNAWPARPLVFQRDAGMRHRPPLRQEDVLDRPIEAAGAAQPGNIPAARHDLRFLSPKDPAAINRLAVRIPARTAVIIDNLETPQHPGGLPAAAAEAPAPGDPVSAVDGHRLAAARNGGAGDDGAGPACINLLDALVRQAERDELANAVVCDVPADRADAVG